MICAHVFVYQLLCLFSVFTLTTKSQITTSEELCDALNNVSVSSVTLTTSIQFSGPCLLKLVNRGVVHLVCTGGDTDLECPRQAVCFDVTESSSSFNSTFATSGCSIVGPKGGFLRVQEAFINITMHNCLFTTQNSNSSYGFVYFEVLKPQKVMLLLRSIIINITNSGCINTSLAMYASCVRVFVVQSADIDSVNVVLRNITISNYVSPNAPIILGLPSLPHYYFPHRLAIIFEDVVIVNSLVSFPAATGGVYLRNVTGTISTLQCDRCWALSTSAIQPSQSGCLTAIQSSTVSITSMDCRDCKAHMSGALYVDSDSVIVIQKVNISQSNATGRGYAVATIYWNSTFKVQEEMIVSDCGDVILCISRVLIEVTGFVVVNSGGITVDNSSVLAFTRLS
eukprot:PhF_6_TR13522/c0_g1_i1/m.21608